MEDLVFIVSIALIIIIGYIGQLAFQKYRIPDIIILILIGLIIGPLMHIVPQSIFVNYISIIADIALIIILFDAGLNLKFVELAKNFKKTIILTILSYGSLAAIIALSLHYLNGWAVKDCLLYAVILAAPSVTVLSVLIKKLDLDDSTKHVFILESTISDILIVVLAISLLSFSTFNYSSILTVSKSLLENFLVGIFFGVIVGILWLELLRLVEKWEFSYTLTLAVLFILFVVSQIVSSSSGMLAVVTFGIILGNNDEIRFVFSRNKYIKNIFPLKEWKMSDQIQVFHSEVTFFIKTFMFVSLGVLITFHLLSLRSLLLSALILAIIYLTRYIIVSLMKLKNSGYMIFMIPRGLTQAVVALYVVAVYTDVAMNMLVSIVVTVIIVSNIVSSTYLFLRRKDSSQNLQP